MAAKSARSATRSRGASRGRTISSRHVAARGSAAAAAVRASLVLLLALSLLALVAAPAALAGSGQLAWPTTGVAAFSGLSETPTTDACADGAGGVIVVSSVYAEGTGYDLLAERIAANGSKPWGDTPKVVCSAVNDQKEFVCTSDGAGGVIVVWKDERNAPATQSVLYAQRLNAAGAAQWAANGILIDGVASYYAGNGDPQVLADGAGGVIVAWFHGGSDPMGVRAQRLNAAGAALWTAGGVSVALDDLDGLDPPDTIVSPGPLASDGAGGAMVTFVRAPWAPGNAWERVYVARVAVNGAVAAAPTAVADVVSPLVYYQSFQEIVYDGAGNAIVAWVDMRHKDEVGNPTAYETDLYAQKVRVSDGARLWAAAGQPLCTALGAQDALHLMPGSANGAVAVWADHAYDMPSGPYEYPFICANRIAASGATQWGAASSSGVRIMDVSGAMYSPRGLEGMGVCSDGAGGVYVAWPDERNSVIKYSTGETLYAEEAVYGQHVGADGALKWGTNKEGEALWYGPHDLTYPSLPIVMRTSDSALGAVWSAAAGVPTVTSASVLAQKVSDSSAAIVPHLDSVSPTTVGPKGTITVRGIHLGPFVDDSTTKVLVNGVWADRQKWHDAWVEAILPAGLEGAVNVTVQTPRGTSNALQVTVTRPAPVEYGCTPSIGPAGTAVDLRGDYFGLTQAGSSGSVQFYNATSLSWVTAAVTSWSYQHIFVTVPAGLPIGWAAVRVITDKGTATGSNFNVTAGTPIPAITKLTPTSGVIGSAVQIDGTNFGATKGTSTVKFGTLTATTSAWGSAQITATVPAGLSPGPVNVTVTTPGGTSTSTAGFTVTAVPIIAISAPTASSVWPSGSAQTVAWTVNPARTGGEFRVWLVSAAGAWYINKQVLPVAAKTSYSTAFAASVPAAAGYKAYVYWRPTVGSGTWTATARSAAFTVTPINITSPTAASSWPSGSLQSVTWTVNPARTGGEFRVWLVSASGGWYINKQVLPVAAKTSYATAFKVSVPAGAGYKAYVYYRPAVGSGTWTATAKSAAFTVQ